MAAVAVHVVDKDVISARHGYTVVLIDDYAVTNLCIVRTGEIEACGCQLQLPSNLRLHAPSLLCDAGNPFERAFGAYPALLFSVMWWMSIPALLLT